MDTCFPSKHLIILGSYQIKMAKAYIIDHLQQSYLDEDQLEFIVELCEEYDDLIRARFQSRHSNQKKHIATVQFDEHNEQPITGWYCTCAAGGREVGMCSHITALLWHLGVERATIPASTHPLSASKLLDAIDTSITFSDQDNSSDSDNDNNNFRLSTTATDDTDNEQLDW